MPKGNLDIDVNGNIKIDAGRQSFHFVSFPFVSESNRTEPERNKTKLLGVPKGDLDINVNVEVEIDADRTLVNL